MKPEQINPQALLNSENETGKKIVFSNGLPGFENLKTYILLKEPQNPSVFILQSEEKPDIAFPVVLPHIFGINYDIELSDDEAELIGAQSPGDIIVFLILAKDSDDERKEHEGKSSIIANIAGPVVINTATMKGFQKILAAMDRSLNIQS